MGGEPLFDGEKLRPPGRGAAMLPLGLKTGGLTLAYATAGVTGIAEGAVTFRDLLLDHRAALVTTTHPWPAAAPR